MNIIRRGCCADFGPSQIVLQALHCKWNNDSGALELTQNRVGDFCTKSNHNYIINIHPEDILNMLRAISEVIDRPGNEALVLALKPGTADALRLVLGTIGVLKYQPTITPKTDS